MVRLAIIYVAVMSILLVLILAAAETAAVYEEAVAPAGARAPTTVQVAVLVPDDCRWLFCWARVAPALYCALEDVNTRGITSVRINISHADSRCSSTWGPITAFDFYRRGQVSVFFGPVCDYSLAPVARYASIWGVPVLTPGGMASDFGSQEKYAEYDLLTRSGWTFNSMAKAMYGALEYHGWKKLVLMFDQVGRDDVIMESHCFLATTAIVRQIEGKGVTEDFVVFNTKRENDEPDFEDYFMRKVGLYYSVVVLCASGDTVRKIMLTAYDLGFTNGEYVFFNIDLFSSKKEIEKPWFRPNDTDNDKAKKAYEALMTVTLRKPESEEYKRFSEKVKNRTREEFNDSVYTQNDDEEVNSFVGAFHDAVILYSLALNETLAANESPENGTAITSRMWNRTFEGITGNVSIDEHGDRNADYSLLDMDPETGIFEVVANYYGNKKKYEPVVGRPIHWAGDRSEPPPDTPKCGFDGSLCPPKPPKFPGYMIAIISLGALLVVVIIFALVAYRCSRPSPFDPIYWQIHWEDIMFGNFQRPKLDRSESRYSIDRRYSIDTTSVATTISYCPQLFIKTGYYKGNQVAIKKISRTFNGNPPKNVLMELKAMRDLQNDHIVRFLGLCIDTPNQCIVTEYCVKGSLQDVLENDQVKLDNMFKFSLMQDIVRGMSYLHGSEVRSHGNLKSSNCVIDSRFVLKITDFGLHSIRNRSQEDVQEKHAYHRDKYWTAPELLRLSNPLPQGTQKGDVYSFAIICQEIMCREGPFYPHSTHMKPLEIIEKVRNGDVLRPCLPEDGEGTMEEKKELNNMISKCWEEDPNQRPDFHAVKGMVRKMKGGESENILDNLLKRMEQYANNLESLVEERTADYLEQKKKAEDLLYLMLPKQVAGQLMKGQPVAAERYDGVTIYFSDIVGFTALSAESTPMQVIDLLNDLYTTFDSIIGRFDVYKVETIGDAYMVVSGLPVRNGNIHAREIARMSLSLLNGVRTFKIRHKPETQLRIRIGIHSGPVCAGVVGLKMPRYCLFGDTVNTASRMESNGEPLKIHVNPATKELLDEFGTFILQLRGEIEMKGKGVVTTWWLNGEDNPEFPDFKPPEFIN